MAFSIDRFDRIMLGAIVVLAAMIGGVVAFGDHVGVPIQRITPEPESSPAVTTPVTLTFGQQMDPFSVQERFGLSPAVTGTFAWQDTTVTFTPDEPLEAGTTYTVTLRSGAQALDGSTTVRDEVWAFTPRAPEVLYLGPSGVQVQSLWSVPLDGSSEPQEIYATRNGIVDFAPSPDGESIVVTVANDDTSGDLWLINADGTNPRQLTDCSPGICDRADWQTDGEVIVYERRDPGIEVGIGPSRLWYYEIETSETLQVFEDNQILGFDPLWSPGGSKLAFYDANERVIRVLDTDGGTTFAIPTEMGEVGTFDADGSRMVYTDIRMVGRQFFTELMVADLTVGSGLEPLFEVSEEDQWPSFSPEGEYLAFGRRRIDRTTGFGSQMMLYNFETGELTQITDDPAINSLLFTWDPTGRYVMFTRFDLEELYAQPEIWVYDTQTEALSLLVEGASLAKWKP